MSQNPLWHNGILAQFIWNLGQEPGAGAPVEGEPWRNEWEKAVRTLAHLSSFGGLEGVGRLEDTGGSLASTHLTGTPPQGETKEH